MVQQSSEICRILWVENDAYHIESLLWWVERDPKYALSITSSLVEATELLQSVQSDHFGLIILDLIMSRQDDQGRVPAWFQESERLGANGILFLKYFREQLSINSPVLLLSIMDNPIEQYNLHAYDPIYYLEKRGLKPTVVKETIEQITNSSQAIQPSQS